MLWPHNTDGIINKLPSGTGQSVIVFADAFCHYEI